MIRLWQSGLTTEGVKKKYLPKKLARLLKSDVEKELVEVH
jgi:hypothetical protein